MKNLFKALAAFQQEVKTIRKNATAGQGSFKYKYADLHSIVEQITPIMARHGLGFTQPLDGSGIRTIIYHVESGEALDYLAELPQDVHLKGQNDYQAKGSGITYFRRYALSSALGIVTDEDADAQGIQIPSLTPEQFNKTMACNDPIKVAKVLEKMEAGQIILTPQQKAEIAAHYLDLQPNSEPKTVEA